MQRLRLATQVRSNLFGVVYVLDEPSAGLHPADTEALLTALDRLKASGNSLFVVEHELDVVRSCGLDRRCGSWRRRAPAAEILYSGAPSGLADVSESQTRRYLFAQTAAAHRSAFGGLLADKPLMRNVLADLAVEAEAATVLALRLAHAVDSGERDFRRLAVAVGKYWVCKRTPAVVGEALECLGGNGYVEESGLPRLYREAPLNSIWEGSGNVNALDVLRALAREPAAVEAFRAEVALARGADRRLDAAADRLAKELVTADEGVGPPAGGVDGAGAAGLAAGAALPGVRGGRVLRLAARGRRAAGAGARHAARRAGHRRDRRAGHAGAALTGC